MSIRKASLEEEKLINGGFLAISLALVVAFLNRDFSTCKIYKVECDLVPLVLFCLAVPPLAFNSFVIKYRHRFEKDGSHWAYSVLVNSGIFFSILGLVSAIFLKSIIAGIAFLSGFLLVIPSFFYLDSLNNVNENLEQ